MPAERHSKRSILAGAVILIVGALMWFALRENGIAPGPALPPAASKSESVVQPEHIDAAARGDSEREASTALPANVNGPGELRIHVIDSSTRAPVLDATCVVYSEQGGTQEHGVVRTDADGHAALGGLPENVIIVHVLREPPHASAYAAVDWKAGETRDVEIALTAGGTLFGRVVDDVGSAIADAQLFLSSDRPIDPMQRDVEKDPVGHTDAHGRFEIAQVVSSPWKATVVGGELRAEHWLGVSVRAQSGTSQGRAQAQVQDGARVDLGDIVVPRAHTYAGRVLDARRAPVAGAVVDFTGLSENKNWMAASPRVLATDVALGAGKTLTQSDGSFTARTGDVARYAAVTTKDRLFEQFPLSDDRDPKQLELVLKDWSVIEIELVDDAGKPVTTASPAVHDKNVRMISAKRQIASNAGQIETTLVVGDQRQIHAEFVADADGLFRLQTTDVAGQPRRLHIELPGYLPLDADIGVQTAAVERHRFTLHPIPALRLHVDIAAQPPAARPTDRLTLYVQACLLDPAEYASRVTFPGSQCCGQGSVWSALVETGERDVELPVLANGNYWLHAEIPASDTYDDKGRRQKSFAFEAHFGPFAADGSVHEVKVPSIDPLPRPEPARKAVPPSTPTSTSLLGRIVDATTQKGIDYASIQMTPVPNPGGVMNVSNFLVDHEGKLRNKVIMAGLYSMQVFARKYRVPAARDVSIADGKVLDLGTIALEPIPATTLRLLEVDGRPVPRLTHVEVRSQNGAQLASSQVKNDEGAFVLQEDLGAGVTIRIDEPRPHSDVDDLDGRQWLMHDFRSGETPVELRLAPWHPIEVRVGGAIQDFPSVTLSVVLDRADRTPTFASYRLTELLPMSDGTRRFRGEVGGPGQAKIGMISTFLQPSTQLVQVGDAPGLQTFVIESAR